MNILTWVRVVLVAAQFIVLTLVNAAPFAYFVTPAGNLLAVDTATNTIAPAITVGANPYAAVVNPAGTRVYVSNFSDDSVSVVDTATNAVIATVPVAARPQGLAVSPTGSRIYVAGMGGVSVIDAGTNTVVTTIPISNAVDVAINTSGTLLYVAAGGVTIVDTASNLPVATVPIPAGLSAFGTVALSPNDSLLYAWADQAAKIAVFNVSGASASFAGSISIPAGFDNDGMAFDPTGTRAYHSTGSNISIINPLTSSVVSSVPLAGGSTGAANGVAVTPDGARVYAATAGGARAMDAAPPNTVVSIPTGSVRALGKFVGPTTVGTSMSFSGPTATGTGTATGSFMCTGAANCTYTRVAWISVPGGTGAPPVDATIAGVRFPQGLFDFVVVGSNPGFTTTFTLTFPQPLPIGTVYYKYGPTAAIPAPHWYQLPATIVGNIITFSITDGGLGDDDLTANGTIVDQGGPGAPPLQSLVYKPLEPCRIMDTRSATAGSGVQGPIAGNSLKTLPGFVTSGSNWGQYGGSGNSDCGLTSPPGTSIGAVALVATILNPNFDAYLGMGDTPSLSSVLSNVALNFTSGQGLSTMYIVPQLVANNIYFAMPAGLSAQVIFDVVGYQVVSDATALQCTTQSSAPVAIGVAGSGTATSSACGAGFTLTSGSCDGTSFTLNLTQNKASDGDTTWLCAATNRGGSSANLTATATCCRVPGK